MTLFFSFGPITLSAKKYGGLRMTKNDLLERFLRFLRVPTFLSGRSCQCFCSGQACLTFLCRVNRQEVWRPATTSLMHDTGYTMQDKGGNDLIMFIVVVKLA